MKINFLDREFPKEFKNKIYELKVYIQRLFNLKSYKFKFNTFDMLYVFELKKER